MLCVLVIPDVTGSGLSLMTLYCFRAGQDAFVVVVVDFTAEDGAGYTGDS